MHPVDTTDEDALLALLAGTDAPDREQLLRLDPRLRSPRFLDRMVAAALQSPEVIALANQALSAAVAADPRELPRLVHATELFIDRMLRQDPGDTRLAQVVADLERAGHRHNAPLVVAYACWHRLVIALNTDEAPRVFEASDALLDKIDVLANAPEDEFSHEGRSALSWHLFEAAKFAYYEGNNTQIAVPLIDAALRFNSVPVALRLAGSIHVRTGNTSRARECLMRLVQSDEAIAADFYSLGNVEFELGNPQAAAPALRHAVAQSPENGIYALQLSSVLVEAGDLESAEVVLDDAADKCQLMQAREASAPPESWNTYVTSQGERFRLDEALLRIRMNIFEAALRQGRPDLARRQLEAVKIASPPLPSVQLRASLSRVLWAEGAHAEALSTFNSVVHDIGTDEAHLIRAKWLIETLDFEGALADISVVVHGWLDTGYAAKLLRSILELQPDNATAYRLLACALARPTNAEILAGISMLDGIISRDPTDAFALYCRGLARMAVTSERGDDPYLVRKDVFFGFLDLCQAREAAPQDAQIIHAWRWMIDRLSADQRYLGVWLQMREGPAGIGRVAPAECRALLIMSEAMRLGVNKRHGDAVKALHEARTALTVADLPATASICNLLLADNLLRLHELEEARRCLDAFDHDFLAICTRPLSPELAEATQASEQERAGTVATRIAFHREFMHIQLWGVAELQPVRNMLHAESLSRLGRHDEALAAIADWERELLADSAPNQQMINGVENLAIILRNAKACDRALAVLEHARPYAQGRNVFRLDHCRASLLVEAGDFKNALPLLESLWPADPKDADNPMFEAVRGNLANLYARTGQPRRAIELLTPMLARASTTPRARLKLHVDLLWASHALHEVDESCAHAVGALASFGEMRASMSRLEDRQWLTREYESSIDAALKTLVLANRVNELFAAVEALRAHSWEEQHARRAAAPNSDTTSLDAKIERTERIESLLIQLRTGVNRLGPRYIDAEIMANLRSLDPLLPIFHRNAEEAWARVADETAMALFIERIERSLFSCQSALDKTRAQRERLYPPASAGIDLVTPASLHSALRGAKTSGQRVVFVHILSVDDRIWLLRVTSDEDKPALSSTAASAAALAAFAQHDPNAQQSSGAWEEFSAAIVEVLEPGDITVMCVTGALAKVPFHAFPVAGKPWCGRNPISRAPSGTSLVRCLSQPRPEGSAVVIGDPSGNLLRGRDEARFVADLLGVTPLLGNQATVTAVQSALKTNGPSVIHFACHGTAGRGDDESPSLLLAPTTPTDDGRLTVKSLSDSMLPGARAVLSACDSAHAEGPTRTEVFGLPRALLIAGARSVVASLWETNDTATFLLMQRFYLLLPALPMSAALALSQLWLRGLTIAEVVAYAAEALTNPLAPDTRARLLRHLAAEQIRAHDYIAARRSLERLLAETPEDQAPTEHAQARRLLGRLTDAGEPREAIDYSARPFSDLSSWAPFILMGDWR